MAETASDIELNHCPKALAEFFYVPKEENGFLTTNFHSEIEPTSWHSTALLRLQRPEGESLDSITYTVDRTYDFLLYVYMTFRLPEIRIKPEYADSYRIRWVENVGTNRIEDCHLRYDGKQYPGFDSVWLDFSQQWYVPGDRKDEYEICNGNIPSLQEFSTHLPEHTINIEQPWFYSLKGFPGWPILNTSSDTVHHYTFRPLLSLLQVEKLDPSGKWNNITAAVGMNIVDILDFPNGRRGEIPELWGKYGLLNSNDRKTYRGECGELRTRSYCLKGVMREDSANYVSAGTSYVSEFRCEYPVSCIFWACRSRKSTAARDFSNYTDNSMGFYEGRNPVGNVSLEYGQAVKFSNFESHHFNTAMARYHFPACPRKVGYHAYSFANDSGSSSADICHNLVELKARMTFHLSSGSNLFDFRNPDNPETNDAQYHILTRLLTFRILKLECQPDGSCTFDLI